MGQTTALALLPTAEALAEISSRLAVLIGTPGGLQDISGDEETECLGLLRCLRNVCAQHPSLVPDLAAGHLLEALAVLLASPDKQSRGAVRSMLPHVLELPATGW